MTDFSSGFFGNKSIGFGKGSSSISIKKRSYVNVLRGIKIENDPFTDTLVTMTNAYSSRWDMTGDPPPQYKDFSGQIPTDVLNRDLDDFSFNLPVGINLGFLFSVFMNDNTVDTFIPRKVLCAPVFFDYGVNEDKRENTVYHLFPGIVLPIIGSIPIKVGEENDKDVILPCYMLLGQ